VQRRPFALRMAGFPFEWLTGLADAQTAAAADEVVAGAGTPADQRPLLEEYRRRYDTALEAERLAVCERFVRDEAVRDTVFALNPAACGLIEHWLDRIPLDPAQWRTKDRMKLDPLTLYLQRMCAKNDSTGHAGPFAVGRFDPGAEGVGFAEAPLRHHAFLSRWAAEAILAWYTATHGIPARAVPRRAPGLALDGAAVDLLRLDYSQRGEFQRVVGERSRILDLSDEDRNVLEHCDGARTVAEVGAALGIDAGPSVRRLADLGMVIPGPEIPYGVADAMPILSELAEQERSPELTALVSGCAQTLAAQALGDRAERWKAMQQLGELLERTTGVSPERGRGGFYQDRALVYEESVGRLDGLVLGRGIAERVGEALPLITDAFLFLPRLRHRLEHDVLAEWFDTRFPAGTASVNDYLHGFAEDEPKLASAFEQAERTLDSWHDRLREAAGATGDPGPGTGADALEHFQKFLAVHAPRIPAVCDLDLMLVASPGHTLLQEPDSFVVSEVHADEELLTHGMFAPFVAAQYPDLAQEVLTAYQGLLAEGEILMNATVRHTNKTYAREPLQCPEIEAADRSPLPAGLRRQFADLVVRREADGLRLVEREGRTVRLVTAPLSWLRLAHNPMEVFGFPTRRTGSLFRVRPGEILREVAFGDFVLSRRTWSVAAERLRAKDARAAFLAVRTLRDQVGLPRHVFASADGEGKPVYVDLDSPLLVRQLTRFAAQSEHLKFTEMLPGPEQLWLRVGGHSYTSELRFAAFDGRR
jgi:hypothetical protein